MTCCSLINQNVQSLANWHDETEQNILGQAVVGKYYGQITDHLTLLFSIITGHPVLCYAL